MGNGFFGTDRGRFKLGATMRLFGGCGRELNPSEAVDYRRLKAQACKVHEEAGELMVAMADWAKVAGGTYDGVERVNRQRMLDELADLAQALGNAMAAFGVTDEEFSAALGRCEDRNSSRGRY